MKRKTIQPKLERIKVVLDGTVRITWEGRFDKHCERTGHTEKHKAPHGRSTQALPQLTPEAQGKNSGTLKLS